MKKCFEKVLTVLLFAGILITPQVQAKELMAAEIANKLTGFSAVFKSGAKQYFAADGTTLYLTRSQSFEKGLWKVEGDEYCSNWGRGWRCYRMVTTEDNFLIWLGDGAQYQAKLVKGNIVKK